jgi:hypothetical protein
MDLEGFGVVIFTSGFRPDYAHWVQFPAFDAMGFPLTDNGASTVVPGLFFCGVHFLRKRKSSSLIGVGEDAAIVAQSVTATPRPSTERLNTLLLLKANATITAQTIARRPADKPLLLTMCIDLVI